MSDVKKPTSTAGTVQMVIGVVLGLLALYGLITGNFIALVFWGVLAAVLIVLGARRLRR